jgi:aspartyl-tRNA(Asn)/glutamyl-tRNA(Gln) amidotransferase subunit C
MFKLVSFLTKYRSTSVLKIRSLHSAIPSLPVVAAAQKNNTKATAVDESTVDHLERLSLVDFANARGIQRLEEAIQLANKLSAVDTTNVEPMYSVLEDK